MGRTLEVMNGRIVSRRVGSVDWQDAMESFGMYSALIEDTGASQLLMNMSEAEVLIPGGDARDLAVQGVDFGGAPEHRIADHGGIGALMALRGPPGGGARQSRQVQECACR